MIRFAILLGMVVLFTGCATPYMMDRGRDAADIFTAAVGIGAGAKVRVGPLQTGLLLDLPRYGWRGGVAADADMYTWQLDAQWLIGGMEALPVESDPRHKDYFAASMLTGFEKEIPPMPPLIFAAKSRTDSCPSFYTQIEAVIGLGGSLRLGFNLGELLDFILGWATIDIFNDDLEWKKRKSNHEIQPTK